MEVACKMLGLTGPLPHPLHTKKAYPFSNFSSQKHGVGAQHTLPDASLVSRSAPGFQKLRELPIPDGCL